MPDTTLHLLCPLAERLVSSAAYPRFSVAVPLSPLRCQYLLAACARKLSEGTSGILCTYMDVLPTAGATQLNRMVGAYSNAIVLVAT